MSISSEIFRIIVLIVTISGYSYCAYHKQKTIHSQVNPVVLLTDQAAHILLGATTIISVYVLYRRSSISRFKLTPESKPIWNNNKKYHRTSLPYFLAVIIIVALNTSFILKVFGWSYYKYYCFSDLNFILHNIVTYNLLSLLKSIENMLKDTKNILKSSNEFFTLHQSVVLHKDLKTCRKLLKRKALKTIRFVAIKYSDLGNYTEEINMVFGPIIIFSVLHLIVRILFAIVVTVEFSIKQIKVEGNNIANWIIGVYFNWFCALTITAVRLAVAGQHIEDQISNTKKICFDNINACSESNNNEDIQIQTELLQLHDQIKMRNISVNAAGCFEINFQLIGIIYSSLITLSVYAVEFLLYYS